MSNRHLARSIVMQTLFEWDFLGESEKISPAEALRYNAEEFAPGVDDVEFLEALLKGVLAKRSVLDQIIEKAAPEWPIDKINAVDRNVLRLGLYELLFGDRDQVPPKVAINEAIELAKSFGGDKSGSFVNGVLGAIYKEIGEPGKDQTSRKQKNQPVDLESLPIEQKGGAVIFAHDGDTPKLALVHDVFNYWTLSKGGIKEGETPEEGTARAIKEEIEIDVTIKEKLGENEYIANHPEKGKIRKQVTYFLAETTFQDLRLINDSGGLDDARWFALDELTGLTIYDDVLQMITKAITIITKK